MKVRMTSRGMEFCGREELVRDGVGVLIVYAVMALADGLGVLSSRAELVGVSSTLFFLWFAVLPIPVGSMVTFSVRRHHVIRMKRQLFLRCW